MNSVRRARFNIRNCLTGFGLLEIIIGAAIISISLFSLAAVSQISLNLSRNTSKNVQAGFLLEEGMEAVKIMRDSGWTANIASLNPDVFYYFDFNGTTWKSTTTNIYVDDIFERKFTLGNVYRDINDDIALSGALDPNTKKLSVFVSWSGKTGTTTKSIPTYITNLFNN